MMQRVSLKWLTIALCITIALVIMGCQQKKLSCNDGSVVADESLCPKYIQFDGYVSRGEAYYGPTPEVGQISKVKEGCYATFFGDIENKGNVEAKGVKITCDGHPNIEKTVGNIPSNEKVNVDWRFNQECADQNFLMPFNRCFIQCDNCGSKEDFSASRSSRPIEWKIN